jgi:hypothetical protein
MASEAGSTRYGPQIMPVRGIPVPEENTARDKREGKAMSGFFGNDEDSAAEKLKRAGRATGRTIFEAPSEEERRVGRSKLTPEMWRWERERQDERDEEEEHMKRLRRRGMQQLEHEFLKRGIRSP